MSPMDPAGSAWRIPPMAASAVMPPPMIRYLYCGIVGSPHQDSSSNPARGLQYVLGETAHTSAITHPTTDPMGGKAVPGDVSLFSIVSPVSAGGRWVGAGDVPGP